MREPANIDAIIDLMDRTPEEMDAQNVPAPVRDRILRIRALYAWWLINPRKTDQELVFKDMQDYKVQRMMAYNDLHLIKLILGNLQKVSKDFARYRFDQMIQRTYEKADNMAMPEPWLQLPPHTANITCSTKKILSTTAMTRYSLRSSYLLQTLAISVSSAYLT